MSGKTSILQPLDFLACSGIQECLLAPNGEGRFTDFPVDPPCVTSMGLSLADPSIGDQVIVLVRTSDGRVLARMRFDAHEFMLGAQKSQNTGEICLTFSVPFVASRLVVQPRQSRGEVSFNSLRVLA